MDMHAIDRIDSTYDVVWCRHALEHSPMPAFVLSEFRRVLRGGGYAYIEVPAGGTVAGHEHNPSHHSIFSPKMWEQTFYRAGFDIVAGQDIQVPLDIGPDLYHAWLLRKPRITEDLDRIDNILREDEASALDTEGLREAYQEG